MYISKNVANTQISFTRPKHALHAPSYYLIRCDFDVITRGAPQGIVVVWFFYLLTARRRVIVECWSDTQDRLLFKVI